MEATRPVEPAAAPGLRRRGPLALVWVAAAALYFAGLGAMPLTDRDEGEYAAAVSAMRRTGDYVVPKLNGRPYLEKPILVFWMIAGAQRLFGVNECATRLPSAASAFLLVVLLAAFLRRQTHDAGSAAVGGALLGGSPLFAGVARTCLTDMPLTLFTTGAVLAFFLGTEHEAPRDRRWYAASWALLALGILTKGPVACAVVLPTAGLYALWRRRLMRIVRRANLPLGLGILLAVNLPWYGLVAHRLGREFWESFLVSQNFRRFGETLLGHGGSVCYYVPVLLLGAFPVAAAGIAGWVRTLAALRHPASAGTVPARLAMLAAIAVAVIVAVFTAAATKLPHYILPALPFLAVLAAVHLAAPAAARPSRTLAALLVASGAAWAAALVAGAWCLPALWATLGRQITPDHSEYALPERPPAVAAWLVAAAVVFAATTAAALRPSRRRPQAAAAILGAGSALATAFILAATAIAVDAVQRPAVRLARELRSCDGARAEVVSFGLWKPALLWYAGRDIARLPAQHAAGWDGLRRRLDSGRPVFVLTRTALRAALGAESAFRVLAADGGYLLGGNPPALAAWRAAHPPPGEPPSLNRPRASSP